MTDSDSPDQKVAGRPTHRPLERFWPYAELSEQPSEQELAELHPELREVLFGAPSLPFSMAVVFRAEGETGARAVALAEAADEHVVVHTRDGERHRARFYPGSRPADLRDLYELVGALPDTEVLVDDRPVPYARELWLPLVWFLIR